MIYASIQVPGDLHPGRPLLVDSLKSSRKPLSFYHQSVKHLDPPPPPNAVPCYEVLLPRCHGVTHIIARHEIHHYSHQVAQLFSELHPTHFSGWSSNLLNLGPVDFFLPFFRQITHLNIFEIGWYNWTNFGLLPSLTHLCLWTMSGQALVLKYRDRMNSALKLITNQCAHLQLCIVEFASWGDEKATLSFENLGVDDERVTYMKEEDYDSGDVWKSVGARFERERLS